MQYWPSHCVGRIVVTNDQNQAIIEEAILVPKY